MNPVHVIGGGMAGCEAAWQLARGGVPVVLHEMRPVQGTDAHETDGLAELVCSNSFRSDNAQASAVGVLHEEMRRCGSLIIGQGDANRVPAGDALAVDRVNFSAGVTAALETEPLVTIERGVIDGLPPAEWGSTIIATGPLTAAPLAEAIRAETGEESLAFFDALAPIIYKDSIDFSKVWMQSRYDKGDGADYINCPLSEDQYFAFIDALIAAPKTEFKDWEKDTPYFDGCLPIEVMAERGPQTLSYGPMKPVGLTNPHSDEKPYAVVQLRQDNALGTLYNMVGFQTKMIHGAQTEVLRTIPGLENARFARLGGIHRNTFINSPVLLDRLLRLKSRPDIRFAGQITGVEGYIESAAIGLLAGRMAAAEALGETPSIPPETTALGALLNHITGGHVTGRDVPGSFQPMNINFGLLPPLAERVRKKERKAAMAARALADLDAWLSDEHQAAAE